MYKSQRVCQKHYFRYMRYGTYELTAKPGRYRYTHSSGYQLIKVPEHPLANSTGYVYEHRKVMYDKYGESIPNCEICGKETSWEPYSTHVDHINRDKSDNRTVNLRILCNGCNSQRDVDVLKRKGVSAISIGGVSKTANGWSSHPKANHSGVSIWRRLHKGMSAYEAVFGENKTHPKSLKNNKRVGDYRKFFTPQELERIQELTSEE